MALTRQRQLQEGMARVCATATSADELLDGLAAAVHQVVPHDAATWFGVDPVTMLATSPSRVENLDGELCDTFWHLEFHEQDVAHFADLAVGDGVSAMHLSLEGRMARSPRYRDFMVPQGYADELRAAFRVAGSTWGVVGLYREPTHAPFDAEDLAVVQSISSMVAGALRDHVRAMSPWLGQPSAPGLLIVDADGVLISANADAVSWLRDLWPEAAAASSEARDLLNMRGRGLEVPTALYALVARARAVASGHERVPARLRLRDRRGRWIVLHASAMRGDGADGTDAVGVVIEAAKSAEVAPLIIEAYSLTPRERDVLGAIARGGSTAEIAAELFLSPHTVRDYIKAVYEKFGVSSRSELVSRLFGEHYSDRLHDTMVHA